MSFWNHPVIIAAGIAIIALITIPLLAYLLMIEWFTVQSSTLHCDDLTGLYDRKALRTQIQRVLKNLDNTRLRKCGSTVSGAFVIIDLDCFKQVNDTYGHPSGDQLLAHISNILKSNIRSSDIIGRLGGDEFIIFLTNIMSPEHVEAKVSELSRTVQSSLQTIPEWNQVTISVGVALAPRDGREFDLLYQKADLALYEAKKAGKNQIMVCGGSHSHGRTN